MLWRLYVVFSVVFRAGTLSVVVCKMVGQKCGKLTNVLPGYHRGYVLEHLLQTLQGSKSPNSPNSPKSCALHNHNVTSWTDDKDALTRNPLTLLAVEIGVWRGMTSERLLRSFPCLLLLSVA